MITGLCGIGGVLACCLHFAGLRLVPRLWIAVQPVFYRFGRAVDLGRLPPTCKRLGAVLSSLAGFPLVHCSYRLIAFMTDWLAALYFSSETAEMTVTKLPARDPPVTKLLTATNTVPGIAAIVKISQSAGDSCC